MIRSQRNKKIGAELRIFLPLLILIANLFGCNLPDRADLPPATIEQSLDVLSEEIPFIDKAARANPHPGAQGRYSDKFPDIVLTDHLGRKHRFYSDLVKDRIVAIQFFYTTCSGI